jgi:hypothetical protein
MSEVAEVHDHHKDVRNSNLSFHHEQRAQRTDTPAQLAMHSVHPGQPGI